MEYSSLMDSPLPDRWREIDLPASGLSARTVNAARWQGFTTCGELVDACLAGHDLVQPRHLISDYGPKSQAELIAWVERISGVDRAVFTAGRGSIEERLAAVQAEIEALQIREQQLLRALSARLT